MTDSLAMFGTDYTGATGIKATGTSSGDLLAYVRSRATNYYAYCGQLTIVQTA